MTNLHVSSCCWQSLICLEQTASCCWHLLLDVGDRYLDLLIPAGMEIERVYISYDQFFSWPAAIVNEKCIIRR